MSLVAALEYALGMDQQTSFKTFCSLSLLVGTGNVYCMLDVTGGNLMQVYSEGNFSMFRHGVHRRNPNRHITKGASEGLSHGRATALKSDSGANRINECLFRLAS